MKRRHKKKRTYFISFKYVKNEGIERGTGNAKYNLYRMNEHFLDGIINALEKKLNSKITVLSICEI